MTANRPRSLIADTHNLVGELLCEQLLETVFDVVEVVSDGCARKD